MTMRDERRMKERKNGKHDGKSDTTTAPPDLWQAAGFKRSTSQGFLVVSWAGPVSLSAVCVFASMIKLRSGYRGIKKDKSKKARKQA
jgi:hypothetical protein